VQEHAVVDLLNQFRHVLLQFFHRMIGARVGFLLLQRFEKTSGNARSPTAVWI
jgi:hypothetical protein